MSEKKEMTREEAIEALQKFVNGYEKNIYGEAARQNGFVQAIKVVISALRPITREQVEKTKAVFCQPCVGDFEQDTWRCSKCFVQEFGDVRGINFCPHCGAPMTEEAVQIVMQRLEALKDGKSD